jgi:hypothetical protein
MIDILSTSQILLRDAGFSTRVISLDRMALISFEDEAILGFCSVFETVNSLITEWKQRELACLSRFAPNLVAAGDKAWNVYNAFLCAEHASDAETREVRWIEENLERTRKIAACDITTRDELVRAFLPVLPLQFQPALRTEDVTQRLERRIAAISPRAAQVALDTSVVASEVVRLLGEP